VAAFLNDEFADELHDMMLPGEGESVRVLGAAMRAANGCLDLLGLPGVKLVVPPSSSSFFSPSTQRD